MKNYRRFREFSLVNNESLYYGKNGQRVITQKIGIQSLFSSIKLYLYEAFLPRGYPASVSDDYMEYQLWDSLQACCSTLSGMLAVQSVLMGVGVGQANATPLAAAVTWFTKDGIGMISGIMFAWLKGTSLDADCKKWRLFADFVNDLALCIELSISIWQMNAIILLCISSALKSLVGVAGGATRAVVTQHQAIRGNTADVAAKDGSQETLVNLITTIFGIGFIHLEFTQQWAWILMLVLVILHLYFNYRAVKSLKFKTCNEERLWIIFTEFVKTGKVMSVDQVNKEESVFVGFRKKFRNFKLKVGYSLENLEIDFETIPENAEYLIIGDKKSVTIGLKNLISDDAILHAYLESMFRFHDGIPLKNKETINEFKEKMENVGWDLKNALLPIGPWRYEINDKME